MAGSHHPGLRRAHRHHETLVSAPLWLGLMITAPAPTTASIKNTTYKRPGQPRPVHPPYQTPEYRRPAICSLRVSVETPQQGCSPRPPTNCSRQSLPSSPHEKHRTALLEANKLIQQSALAGTDRVHPASGNGSDYCRQIKDLAAVAQLKQNSLRKTRDGSLHSVVTFISPPPTPLGSAVQMKTPMG